MKYFPDSFYINSSACVWIISWSECVIDTMKKKTITWTMFIFILNFSLIRQGFISIYSVLFPFFLCQRRDNITDLPLPSRILSKSWRPCEDHIYQHLVGVRLVFISNTGCDPKSTRAGLSHAAPPTPPSSASWFPDTSESRSQMAPDGETEISVERRLYGCITTSTGNHIRIELW